MAFEDCANKQPSTFFHPECDRATAPPPEAPKFPVGPTLNSRWPFAIMNAEQKHLLCLPRLPARLDVSQAAQLLGFTEADLRTLVAARLLKPLGQPSPNSPKFFAAVELEQLRTDLHWLARATEAVHRHWRRKNHTDTNHHKPGSRPNRQRTRSGLGIGDTAAESLAS